MAGDDEYDQDNTLPGGSYSQLLFADDDDVVGLDKVGCFSFSSDQHFSPESPSEMLRFGDYSKECGDDHRYHRMVLVENASRPAQDCGMKCSDSLSPVSSTANSNHNKVNTLSKYNKKRNGSGKDSSMLRTSITGGAGAGGGNQKNSKKVKTENSTVTGHAKVKKEKLGARISALQQLVSPFGKTDTASVLHEAMGYIRFLHDQVQVLCCPYLQRLSSSGHLLQEVKENGQEEPYKELLRSRGLCLVPVELTLDVADTNGADFWSPAMVNNNVSSNQ